MNVLKDKRFYLLLILRTKVINKIKLTNKKTFKNL